MRCVLAKAVQDDAQRILADLVRVLRDARSHLPPPQRTHDPPGTRSTRSLSSSSIAPRLPWPETDLDADPQRNRECRTPAGLSPMLACRVCCGLDSPSSSRSPRRRSYAQLDILEADGLSALGRSCTHLRRVALLKCLDFFKIVECRTYPEQAESGPYVLRNFSNSDISAHLLLTLCAGQST